MPQPLNSKDGASFRQLVKLYEAKQHKKAIKTADGILKKNPKHGDTMAMKALTLNAQGHTEEGLWCMIESPTMCADSLWQPLH
jgi:peptide alpha-N-acetyltransferase